MGVFSVEGEHAGEFLDLVTTANASRLPNGRAAYTYLLDPTGHPLDDLIIYRMERERFLAVVNAANTEKNWVWLNGVNERQYEIEPDDPWAEAPIQVTLRDLKAEAEGDQRRLDLALQGPRSREMLARLTPDEDSRRRLRRLRAFDVGSFTLAGIDLEVAHTGYTGERVGFELLVHPDAANDLWHAILDAGFDDGVRPAGLGSRDSTRTEAGLPLYGHELGGELDLTPGDAGFGGFVKLYKPFFIGRSGFVAREKRRTSQIVRFAITDERVPIAREGDPVVDTRVRLGRHRHQRRAGYQPAPGRHGPRHAARECRRHTAASIRRGLRPPRRPRHRPPRTQTRRTLPAPGQRRRGSEVPVAREPRS